ncbi:MAG: DUF4350 domain-containing protein [Ilumatobacter sp.]
MARSATQSSGAAGGLKTAAAVVFVLAMALVVLLLVSARPGPEPFDPRSGQPSGARGLVLTLQSAGAEVNETRTVPSVGDAETTRILVLEDRLNNEQRDAVLDFAESGGVVVVGDPDSSLHGGSNEDGGAISVADDSIPAQRRAAQVEANVLPGRCTIAALSELRGVTVPDGVLFPVGPDEPQCFTDAVGRADTERHSFVIVREFGSGLIVGLGDNEVFVNRSLRESDNAGLAVALLAPSDRSNVAFLLGDGVSPTVQDVGSGDDTLRDLVPTWVWMSLVLGGVAFVVFAVSSSSREGRILSEPIATPIAGSELVSATGNLMQRAGHASKASWLLLSRLHRDLCRTHGIDLNAPLSELDRAVAHRSGVAPGETEQLLARTAADNAGLGELSAAIGQLRLAVFGEQLPTSDDASRASRDHRDSDHRDSDHRDPDHRDPDHLAERVPTP